MFVVNVRQQKCSEAWWAAYSWTGFLLQTSVPFAPLGARNGLITCFGLASSESFYSASRWGFRIVVRRDPVRQLLGAGDSS